MDIQRTIPIILDKNNLVDDTIIEFNRYQRELSKIAFNNSKHLRALELHHKVYHSIPTTLTSQMKCNAIRATASSYASAKSNRKPATKPFIFRHPQAIFLFTKDFSFRNDGTLSISTLQGRQKIGWKIPDHFKQDFDSAKSLDSLHLAKGKAFLCITLEVPDPKSVIPVGIDLGINNALVASTSKKTLIISGKKLSIKNTKTRKVRSRLQTKLAEKKAQHKNTRSVVRVLKRLSRKTKNRNKTFCQETAAKLCNWVPQNAILVFENLNFKPKSKKEHIRNGTRRKLNSWFFNTMTMAVKNRAERQGLDMVYINPAFTSQIHNTCGLMGQRFGSKFYCPGCDIKEHADVNASKNILLNFTVLRSSGLQSISPETLSPDKGKLLDLSKSI